MRRITCAALVLSTCVISAASLELTKVTVGSHLQTSASVRLSEPAPEGGLEITVTSEAPGKVRFTRNPEQGGGDSLTLTVQAGLRESPEFWVQGMAAGQEVPYTATASGFGSGKSSVVLTPSAIVIAGPYRGPRFPTTTGAVPSKIDVYTVRLDSSLGMGIAEQQLAAVKVDVELLSSAEKVGAFINPRIKIERGTPGGSTEFKPSSAGSTTLSLSVPPGFSKPAAKYAIVADVALPGLSLLDEVRIGQNLQIGGSVGLGEAAPPAGLQVTVTSEDPASLLISKSATEVGSKSIVLTIPEHGIRAQFVLQALGKTGKIGYSASAPGFRTRRSNNVVLTPSGIVIAPTTYGPPDEAELHRKGNEEGDRGFVSELSKKTKMPLGVWVVQLDPVTLRSADVTVQSLRAGMSINVDVLVSDPALAGVISPVTIKGGDEMGSSEFTPLAKGKVVITAVTPAGFTKSTNSTTINAIIKD